MDQDGDRIAETVIPAEDFTKSAAVFEVLSTIDGA